MGHLLSVYLMTDLVLGSTGVADVRGGAPSARLVGLEVPGSGAGDAQKGAETRAERLHVAFWKKSLETQQNHQHL